MITLEEIFEALREVVNRAAPELFVTADSVQTSEKSYAQITFRPRQVNEGFGAIRREVAVDVAVVLAPDEFTEVYHSDLMNISDALMVELDNYLQVGDRAITLYELNSRVFDKILRISFYLNFADYNDRLFNAETENLELMQELHIKPKNC